MITDELLRGVLDIVKGILGVKSQNAEIMLTRDGKIIFRIDRTMLYVIQTDMFILNNDTFIKYNEELSYLDNIGIINLMNIYNECMYSSKCIIRQNNLQEDEIFTNLANLKSNDGIGYYRLYDANNNVYHIPFYTGFVKFNKGDQCDIEIYNHSDEYLMNKFIIRKKKIKYPIQVYFMTIKYNPEVDIKCLN